MSAIGSTVIVKLVDTSKYELSLARGEFVGSSGEVTSECNSRYKFVVFEGGSAWFLSSELESVN